MPDVNPKDVNDICKSLNDKLITEESLFDFAFNGLMDVSASRWGYARYPSPVWTDETDHQYMRERLPNVYQVFGHTQQESEPVITEQNRNRNLSSQNNMLAWIVAELSC